MQSWYPLYTITDWSLGLCWNKATPTCPFLHNKKIKFRIRPPPTIRWPQSFSQMRIDDLCPLEGRTPFCLLKVDVVAFQHFPLHVIYSYIPFSDWDWCKGFLVGWRKLREEVAMSHSPKCCSQACRKKAWVDYMLLFMWFNFPAALHEGSCILCNHGDEASLALGRGLQGVQNGSNYQWCHTGSLLAQWCDKTKASSNPQHYAFGVVCTDACHYIFWYILKRNGIVKKKT